MSHVLSSQNPGPTGGDGAADTDGSDDGEPETDGLELTDGTMLGIVETDGAELTDGLELTGDTELGIADGIADLADFFAPFPFPLLVSISERTLASQSHVLKQPTDKGNTGYRPSHV